MVGSCADRRGCCRTFGEISRYAVGSAAGRRRPSAWLLFHDYLLPFEVTSILMLIAIMGAVVLASSPGSARREQ